MPALDESYVFCFQCNKVMDEIREGFNREGLQGMEGRIALDAKDLETVETRLVGSRPLFKAAAVNMVLPAFVIRDGKDWRLVSYEEDILSRVPWQEADLTSLYDLPLNLEEKRDVELRANLDEQLTGLIGHSGSLGGGALNIDCAYAAGHLLDTVPNPWIGYEFVERVFSEILTRWKGEEKLVANNLVFILEELRKRLEGERDRLAQRVFDRLLDEDKMRFMVVMRDLGMNRAPGQN